MHSLLLLALMSETCILASLAQARLFQRAFAESFWSEMPSAIDACKRALVTLLRKLAGKLRKYHLTLNVTCDSSDSELKAAFKRVVPIQKLSQHPTRQTPEFGPNFMSHPVLVRVSLKVGVKSVQLSKNISRTEHYFKCKK